MAAIHFVFLYLNNKVGPVNTDYSFICIKPNIGRKAILCFV